MWMFSPKLVSPKSNYQKSKKNKKVWNKRQKLWNKAVKKNQHHRTIQQLMNLIMSKTLTIIIKQMKETMITFMVAYKIMNCNKIGIEKLMKKLINTSLDGS